jgi:hypothetical protein
MYVINELFLYSEPDFLEGTVRLRSALLIEPYGSSLIRIEFDLHEE